VIAKNHETVKTLLAAREIDVNSVDYFGRTPLHDAVLSKSHEAVKTLLAAKEIDVNAVDKFGRTPLHKAVTSHLHEIVKALLAARARGIDVNAVDMEGRTPLYLAVKAKNHVAVKALLVAIGIVVVEKGNRNLEAVKLIVAAGLPLYVAVKPGQEHLLWNIDVNLASKATKDRFMAKDIAFAEDIDGWDIYEARRWQIFRRA